MKRVGGSAWLRPSLVAIVLVHLMVLLWHGAAHTKLAIPLTKLQAAFVGMVIFALPLMGAGLLWTDHNRAGGWVVALSMGASLGFGVLNHFVLISPDHVASVAVHPWRYSFILSAALLALTEACGAVLGAAVALRRDKAPRGI